MFDRPASGTAAVLVGLDLGEPGYAEGLEEIRLLAASAGIETRGLIGGRRQRPDPDEVRNLVQHLAVEGHARRLVEEDGKLRHRPRLCM